VDFLTEKGLAGKQHRANRPQDRSRPPVEKPSARAYSARGDEELGDRWRLGW
jgi:hypothetical protein